MIIRCTKKVLDLIGVKPTSNEPTDAGAEWYANLLLIERRKNLLIVEAETPFAVFVADVRKADVTPFQSFATQRIKAALLDEGLPPHTFGSLDPSRITIARTASRLQLQDTRSAEAS